MLLSRDLVVGILIYSSGLELGVLSIKNMELVDGKKEVGCTITILYLYVGEHHENQPLF